jgi:hypothetical protein
MDLSIHLLKEIIFCSFPKQTRSKSKEDVRLKKDTVTPDRPPVRDPEKRILPRPKKEEEMVLVLKKRGRKRKDTDEKSKSEE